MAELSPKIEHTSITIDGKTYPVILCPRSARGIKPRRRERRDDTVGVYLPNCNRPEPYRMKIEAARAMRDQGLARFINRKGDIRLEKKPVLNFSQGNITFAEMKANVDQSRTIGMGEARRQERIARGLSAEDFTERSQAKIGIWPLVFDEKAPRVGPPKEAANQKLARELGFAV